jgi:two-component system, LytTR family, sensor kinase
MYREGRDGEKGKLQFEEVAHPVLLGAEIDGIFAVPDHLAGDALDDFDAAGFEGGDFVGIVGQEADICDPEVAEDRGREFVNTEIRFEAKLFVGLDGVGAGILEFVGADFVEEADAAAFFLFVDDEAAAGGGDGLEGEFKLSAAVATQAVENVAGEALGVNPDEHRFGSGDIAHDDRDGLLAPGFGGALEAVDAELAEPSGQIGFGDLANGQWRDFGHVGRELTLHLIMRRAPAAMEQLLVILLVKLAVAASLASLLSRSSRFLGLLLREERTMVERLQVAGGISFFCVSGSTLRVITPTYAGTDLAMEGSMVAGMVGGYISGLLTGVVCSLPAMMAGEYLAMPLYAAVGVLGGLLRDLAPEPDEIWRFTPFFDLSLYRLVRYPADRRRTVYHVSILMAILAAELVRLVSRQVFGEQYVFALSGGRQGWLLAAVFLTTVFTVAVPLKIWNSARNERLLEIKERLLVQARLSALAGQINPHFLFNTLNTVSSLIRTNPDQARQVVYKLSNILRRLLRKTGSFAPLRDELAFIEDYLSIEMVRFGDKLRFEKAVEPGTQDLQIPAMLLQPLVENSVKHGLASKVEGGVIRVSARRSGDGRLTLTVEDDGVGIEEERLAGLLDRGGIGVRNVNERLQVLFGNGYRLAVQSRPGEGTRTEIDLPAR